MAIKYFSPTRVQDISTNTVHLNAYKTFTSNPGTLWQDLPINGGSNFTFSGRGHLVGLLIRAEGTGDAQWCIGGIRVDGSPGVGYFDWPSGGMSPWWLNTVIGPRNAEGSNFPYQLIKFDTANNKFVVWADFPYPGWPFRSSLRLGTRLVGNQGLPGNLFVWITAFIGTDTGIQFTP
jgi:hypothetical protein